MPSSKQIKGRLGEEIAKKYLENKGYLFRDSQWHCRYGELDLVMMDAGELVFVEVKLRASSQTGFPEDMINQRKIQKIRKTASQYVYNHKLDDTFWRFDIIAVLGDKNNFEISHFTDTMRDG